MLEGSCFALKPGSYHGVPPRSWKGKYSSSCFEFASEVMTLDPATYHIPAVARSQRHSLLVVCLWHILAYPLKTLHNILVRITAPVASDGIRERLAIAGASSRVRTDDDVALLGVNRWIPPCRPRICPASLRAPMYEASRCWRLGWV
ncbi:hypothetical protein KC349_g160 [Hortaea werneckii]|nr:hypothetical protein KC349_g160 [Hortaea werneckii]